MLQQVIIFRINMHIHIHFLSRLHPRSSAPPSVKSALFHTEASGCFAPLSDGVRNAWHLRYNRHLVYTGGRYQCVWPLAKSVWELLAAVRGLLSYKEAPRWDWWPEWEDTVAGVTGVGTGRGDTVCRARWHLPIWRGGARVTVGESDEGLEWAV